MENLIEKFVAWKTLWKTILKSYGYGKADGKTVEKPFKLFSLFLLSTAFLRSITFIRLQGFTTVLPQLYHITQLYNKVYTQRLPLYLNLQQGLHTGESAVLCYAKEHQKRSTVFDSVFFLESEKENFLKVFNARRPPKPRTAVTPFVRI